MTSFAMSKRASALAKQAHLATRFVAIRYDAHMIHKLIVFTAWSALLFIVYATLSPIRDRPTLSDSATLEHVAAFAVLGILLCLAYPRHTILICLMVFGSAVLLELLQQLTSDRHGRIADAIEKVLGGGLGIMVGRVTISFRTIRNWFQN